MQLYAKFIAVLLNVKADIKQVNQVEGQWKDTRTFTSQNQCLPEDSEHYRSISVRVLEVRHFFHTQ